MSNKFIQPKKKKAGANISDTPIYLEAVGKTSSTWKDEFIGASGIEDDFSNLVNDFIAEYRSALEELARV
ncbi:MAG: hypothetical protein JXB15_06720 [Anaerolineales bacterium]|nr:hypothetical protein [Anaerolineales bacterium]